MLTQFSRETNDGIKVKRNTFSNVSNVDVQESMRFFNAELELQFHITLFIFLNLNSYKCELAKL